VIIDYLGDGMTSHTFAPYMGNQWNTRNYPEIRKELPTQYYTMRYSFVEVCVGSYRAISFWLFG